jgi:hypothetical protein
MESLLKDLLLEIYKVGNKSTRDHLSVVHSKLSYNPTEELVKELYDWIEKVQHVERHENLLRLHMAIEEEYVKSLLNDDNVEDKEEEEQEDSVDDPGLEDTVYSYSPKKYNKYNDDEND